MIPTHENQSRDDRDGQKPGTLTGRSGQKHKRLVNRPYLNSKKEKCCQVTIYEGGQLVHLEVPKFETKIKYEEGRVRGKISEFSYRSRQRLMRKVAMIDAREAGLPVFLTLTYPEDYPDSPDEWKRHVHKFGIYLVRKFGCAWGLWKMEFQKRGAPHFHFMLWGLPKILGTKHVRDGKVCWRVLPGISEWDDLKVFNSINEMWFRIVGSGDEKHLAAGVNLEPVQSWKGVSSYVSKYLGKTQGGEFVPVEHTGRFWGVVQGKKWSITKLAVRIKTEVFFRYRRVLRKLQEKAAKRAAMEAKAKGYQRPAWTKKQALRGKIAQGMHWYMDSLNSVRLLAWAAEKR